MPIPRLTSIPDFSSRAMRLAIMACGSMPSSRVRYEEIDDGSGCHNVVRRNDPYRNNVVGAGNDSVGSHRDDRVEIAGGQRVTQIADIIGQESLHQREVGPQRGLKQIGLSSDFNLLLAVLDLCAE